MYLFTQEVAVAAILLGSGAGSALAADATAAQISFVNAAAQSGLMEVAAAKLAVSASRNAAVKEFAYRIIYDCEKMNADLAEAARKSGVDVPAELDATHAGILQSLKDASPQEFDAKYLAQTMLDHAQTAELLRSNLLNPDFELAVFSSYNFPRLLGHKHLAEELQAALTGRDVADASR